MKQTRTKTVIRRPQLPPILEIDEDGLPVSERESWTRPRWNADEEAPTLSVGDWPTDFDD